MGDAGQALNGGAARHGVARRWPSGVGGRGASVGLLAIAVVASAIALNRIGPRPASAAMAGPYSGAWFCPHGGAAGSSAWLAVTNPGRAKAQVRVTSLDQAGTGKPVSFTVGPSQQVYRPIDSSKSGSATEVEYFDGWVAASVVVESRGGSSVMAERCVDAPHRNWILPDVSTGKGERATIVVMNPFDAPAEFKVVLRTEKRKLNPGPLTPFVLKPGRSQAIDVNKFVLEGPGERTVTAQVIAQVGRVIAGSVVRSPSGLRGAAGLTQTAPRWILAAAGYAQGAQIPVVNGGAKAAPLAVLAQGESGSTLVAGLGRGSLPANRARTFDAPSLVAAGIVVSSSVGASLGAALRVSGPTGGDATITGATAPSRRWVVPPTVPESGGPTSLVLLNPGKVAVTVHIRLIGSSGVVPSSLRAVSIEAGHEVVMPLGASLGAPAVSAEVIASSGGVVAAGVSTPLGGRAYAASVGVPVPA